MVKIPAIVIILQWGLCLVSFGFRFTEFKGRCISYLGSHIEFRVFMVNHYYAYKMKVQYLYKKAAEKDHYSRDLWDK